MFIAWFRVSGGSGSIITNVLYRAVVFPGGFLGQLHFSLSGIACLSRLFLEKSRIIDFFVLCPTSLWFGGSVKRKADSDPRSPAPIHWRLHRKPFSEQSLEAACRAKTSHSLTQSVSREDRQRGEFSSLLERSPPRQPIQLLPLEETAKFRRIE